MQIARRAASKIQRYVGESVLLNDRSTSTLAQNSITSINQRRLQQNHIHKGSNIDQYSGNTYVASTHLPRISRSSNQLYCLQYDLTHVNNSDSGKDQRQDETYLSKVVQEIQSMKPEIVFLQYVDEKLYKMELSRDMRKFGYDSHFQHIADGKGHATFYRNSSANGGISN